MLASCGTLMSQGESELQSGSSSHVHVTDPTITRYTGAAAVMKGVAGDSNVCTNSSRL